MLHTLQSKWCGVFPLCFAPKKVLQHIIFISLQKLIGNDLYLHWKTLSEQYEDCVSVVQMYCLRCQYIMQQALMISLNMLYKPVLHTDG